MGAADAAAGACLTSCFPFVTELVRAFWNSTLSLMGFTLSSIGCLICVASS